MALCDACRYCEGFCPVFPELAQTPDYAPARLDLLANLCHNCTACYHACQYKPPHEFAINVPAALTGVRDLTSRQYAWPPALGRALERSTWRVVGIVIATLCATLIAAVGLLDPQVLMASHTGDGAFYQVIGHTTIVAAAGGCLGFAVLAMVMSARRFLAAITPATTQPKPLRWKRALGDAVSLRHLGGGHGEGCNTADDAFSNARRGFHQVTVAGFLLCLAATSVATTYELVLGWMSPFPYTSVPVVLGTLGGIGLLVGPAGLLVCRHRIPMALRHSRDDQMSDVLSTLLMLISLSGFALMLWRESAAMGLLLAGHLGLVLGFFLCMPYGKFMHSVYRLIALARYAD